MLVMFYVFFYRQALDQALGELCDTAGELERKSDQDGGLHHLFDLLRL